MLLLVAFVVIELRAHVPMLPLGIFRSRTLTIANLVGFTFPAKFIGWLFIATLYLQNVLGYSPFQAGLGFVPMGLLAVITANLTPQLINRLGVKWTVVAISPRSRLPRASPRTLPRSSPRSRQPDEEG